MDLSSIFSSGVLRYISLYLVPSAWAAAPYYLLANKLNFRQHIVVTNEFIYGVFVLSILIGAGLVIENIASRIEEENDAELKEADPKFKEKWFSYLVTEVDDSKPVKDYIRSLVMRLKFENSFIVASIIHLVGALCYVCFGVKDFLLGMVYWSLYTAAVIALVLYLRKESEDSSKLLYEIRNRILQEPTASIPESQEKRRSGG